MDIKRIRLCVSLDVNIRGTAGVHKNKKGRLMKFGQPLMTFIKKPTLMAICNNI